ncbi:DMT family transporter [Caenimonas terrae]|uniref:DMT family transporter n=1 Tax=Caenimonas terrae TaxID=696074 RepID=A0ABW0NG33_9BURK
MTAVARPAAVSSGALRGWLPDFVLLAAIWGASFLFMRMGAVEFGAVPTAAARVVIATALLWPLLLLRGLGPQLRRHWKPVFVIGLLNSGLPFVLFSFALLSITTGLSAVLNATAPMFGALIAWAWLRDRPTASRILGLVIGFCGVALLVWDKASFKPDAGGHSPGWAMLACLGACVCYGIAASAAKRYLSGLPALVTATGSQMGASLGLVLPALWLWPAQMPSLHAWLAVLVLGVVCTGIAYVLYFRLIENAGPPRALAVTFLIPVFAVLYGLLFLGETVNGWMVFCAAVIVAGTALATGLLALPRFKRRG